MSEDGLNMDLTEVEEADLDPEDEEAWENRGGHRTPVDVDVEYNLSENVAYDLVKYVRSNTIRNEQQFLLVALGYLTGYFTDNDYYVSGRIIGTSSSGKTHLQNQVENLFRADHMYQATMGTDKSLIYDGKWDEAYIASLDELNKPSDTLIEFLKSCFTPDTDVLTPGGVRSIMELDVGDDVYAMDPQTEELEVKSVTDTIERPNYEGEIIEFETSGVSFRTTPDHEFLRYRGDELVTQTADELADMASFKLPSGVEDTSGTRIETIDLTEYIEGEYAVVTDTDGTEYLTANQSSGWIPRYYDADNFIKLLAWYITEGCTRANAPPYQIRFSQYHEYPIAELLEDMGISYSEHTIDADNKGTQCIITNKLLHNYLSRTCGSRSDEKTIPEWLFDTSVEQRRLLYETLMDGDGDDNNNYYTISTELRDDVSRLLLSIGHQPSYRDESSVATNTDHYWRINTRNDQQWVTKKDAVRRLHTDDIETDGVYCVTVEDNHTLVAGRDGRFSHVRNCHSDDDEFTYKLTPDSAEKREAEEIQTITRGAKPYWFLFAQMDTDFEMANRLMDIPVHESQSKNQAVGRMSFDEHHINIGDDENNYGFDFEDGEKAIQAHIASIPKAIEDGEIPGRVLLPNSEEKFGWKVWDVVSPIFNHGRSESNRVYDMVANIIRASALLNYKNREVRNLDIPNHESGEYIIAEPQDVANVLACRESLLASTHELDDKKRTICSAIKHNTGQQNEADMATIVDGLQDSDMSMLSRPELRKNLEKLHENYLIEIHRNAAENGNADTYQFHGWGELGFANIYEYEGLFEDCFDPISGDNFTVSYEEQRKEIEDDGQDLTSGADTEVTSSTGGQSTLGGGSSRKIDLEPHQEAVRELMKETLDGERIENLKDVPVEALLGLTDPNDPDRSSIDIDDTPLDPTHGCWYVPDKANDWVEDEQDARRHVKNAIRELIDKRVVIYDEVHEVNKSNEAVDVTFKVLGEQDL